MFDSPHKIDKKSFFYGRGVRLTYQLGSSAASAPMMYTQADAASFMGIRVCEWGSSGRIASIAGSGVHTFHMWLASLGSPARALSLSSCLAGELCAYYLVMPPNAIPWPKEPLCTNLVHVLTSHQGAIESTLPNQTQGIWHAAWAGMRMIWMRGSGSCTRAAADATCRATSALTRSSPLTRPLTR